MLRKDGNLKLRRVRGNFFSDIKRVGIRNHFWKIFYVFDRPLVCSTREITVLNAMHNHVMNYIYISVFLVFLCAITKLAQETQLGRNTCRVITVVVS